MDTNISRYRGDTYSDKFTITNTDGSPMDITGFSFKMTLNSNPYPTDNSTQLYQLIGSITDAVNGVVEFSPTALQANNVGKFRYDVQMTDDLGVIKTIQLGCYTYLQNITKD